LYNNTDYLELVLNKENWFLNSLTLRNEKCNIYLNKMRILLFSNCQRTAYRLITDSSRNCSIVKKWEFDNITLQQNLSNTDSSQSSTVNLHQIVFDFCHTLLANSADISDCVLLIALQQHRESCIESVFLPTKFIVNTLRDLLSVDLNYLRRKKKI